MVLAEDKARGLDKLQMAPLPPLMSTAGAPAAAAGPAHESATAKAAWAPSEQPLPLADGVQDAVRGEVQSPADAVGAGGSGEGTRDSAAAAATAAAATAAPPDAAAVHSGGGKGFGGGEATRDPEPTLIDPSDPKAKQQAIHKAESFAEYLARRE